MKDYQVKYDLLVAKNLTIDPVYPEQTMKNSGKNKQYYFLADGVNFVKTKNTCLCDISAPWTAWKETPLFNRNDYTM